MSDKELLIRELIVKDFNEILVNEFCTDWKEKRLYIELLVRATHFDYLLNYIQEKDKEIERLKDLCNKYEEEHKTTFEEWKKAINIIKEIREYIESYNLPKDLGHLGEAPISIRELRDILEILDKESNNE